MRERPPRTQTIQASEARRAFSQLVNQVYRREKRVLIEKSGIPVAAIISAADLEWLARFEQQRREDFAAILQIGEAFKAEPAEEIEREALKAVRQVREEPAEPARDAAPTS